MVNIRKEGDAVVASLRGRGDEQRRLSSFTGACLVLLLQGCSPGLSNVNQIGNPIEAIVTPDTPFSVQVELPAETHVLVTASQDQIDLVLSLKSPDGEFVAVNSPLQRVTNETLQVFASVKGVYTITLSSFDNPDSGGSSLLQMFSIPTQTTDDRIRVDAYDLLTTASAVSATLLQMDAETEQNELTARAQRDYAEAANHWDRIKEIEAAAIARLNDAALSYIVVGSWEDVAEKIDQVQNLPISPTLAAHAAHLRAQAVVETEDLGEIEAAVGVLDKVVDTHRGHADDYHAAVTLNTRGIAHFQLGDLAAARGDFVAAGEALGANGESAEAIKALNNAAKVDELAGDLRAALNTYNVAMDMASQAKLALFHAIILENYAGALAMLGRTEAALLAYHDAIDLFRREQDLASVSRSLDGIGFVYYQLGNWQMAKRYFEMSLAENPGQLEIRPSVDTLLNYGNALRSLAEYGAAVDAHESALELTQRQADMGRAHLELARDHRARGATEQARGHADKASQYLRQGSKLQYALAMKEQAGLLNLTQPTLAAEPLQAALTIMSELEFEPGLASVLMAVARVESRLGNTERALAAAERAVDIVESLRNRSGNPSMRYTRTGIEWPTYELIISLYMRLHDEASPDERGGFAERALLISERARAKTLLELLANNYARPEGGFRVIDERWQKHREMRERLVELYSSRLSNYDDDAEAGDLELVAVIGELHRLEAEIRQSDPYYDSVGARQLSLSDMQALLRDPAAPGNVSVLEYALGEKKSFAWMVGKDSLDSWTLPSRQDLEALSRDVREQLRSRRGISAELKTLSDLLLKPLTKDADIELLVVIPDGALHYVPFAALVIPGTDKYLIEQAELVVLPSVSTLAALRSKRSVPSDTAKALLVVADPEFGPESGLPTLQHTRTESNGIEEIARAHGPVTTMSGRTATRKHFLSIPHEDYRYLHFASHGLINTQLPQLSSIALTSVDESGNSIPGLLQQHDVQHLRLNAELVVLSACDTALGQQIRGEGIVSLSQAFMYAGANGVVATLWTVEDRFTATFMKMFYRKLMDEDLSPSSALRAAQLEILGGHQRWRRPSLWASFVYQGDWSS